jgi:signal transduction histidine kinase
VDVRTAAVEVVVRDRGAAAGPGGPGGPGGAAGAAGVAGVGLVGMRERVAALGGRLAAGPAGNGWEVRAEIPRGPNAEVPRAPGAGVAG